MALQSYSLLTFPQTINLDNAHSLEKRVRDEQKKKVGLREHVLRIRAEREQVALSMDDVRIEHERGSNVAQVWRFDGFFRVSFYGDSQPLLQVANCTNLMTGTRFSQYRDS